MLIRALYLKPARGGPMRAVPSARALGGLGLDGDCQRDPASPRHILLASISSLSALSLPPDALHANLLVDGDLSSLASGTVLRAGDVHLRITFACEACTKLDRIRPGLRRDADGRRGLLARVLTSGLLHPGQSLTPAPDRLPPLSDRWQQRVADIARHIPADHLLTHHQLARIAGVHPLFARAFPRILPPDARVVPNRRGHDERVLWDGASYFTDDEP